MKKKRYLLSLVAIVGSAIMASTPIYAANMERMYNPNSGEHFYTSNGSEVRNLKSVGWKDEGIGWEAPDDGAPVYRLYNPNAGDHHYTTNAAEKNSLEKAGWRYEGIGWYSGGGIPVYRQYNPNAKKAGAHNFTTNLSENNMLVRAGWRAEGISWYATGLGRSASEDTSKNTNIQSPSTENDNVKNEYGTLTGTCTAYDNIPDAGSYILLVPKDRSAYNYNYIGYGITISNSESEKYHIYSAKVNGVGTYSIHHVAAGDYRMIFYSNYYDIVKQVTLGFSSAQQQYRRNVIYNSFAPYINSDAADKIAWIYNASNIHDVTIYPNETTSQDG